MRDLKNKKFLSTDWHRVDVVAALWKRGVSLRKLSLTNRLNPGSAKVALHKPWPKMEQLIAQALDLPPWAIWPSRYTHDGKPNRGRPGRKPKLNVVEK